MRRAKATGGSLMDGGFGNPPDPETELPEPLPTDALPFNDVIEQRFRELFPMCTTPKELTDALKAATDYVKVKADTEGAKWGTALSGGTGR